MPPAGVRGRRSIFCMVPNHSRTILVRNLSEGRAAQSEAPTHRRRQEPANFVGVLSLCALRHQVVGKLSMPAARRHGQGILSRHIFSMDISAVFDEQFRHTKVPFGTSQQQGR